MINDTDFDVIICGAGQAGLTLARQLRLELPQLSVAVIDRLSRPLPEAAFKVGESSVELGTYYYGKVLKLDKYFRERHLIKLGLRFFMGKSQGKIQQRPETGTNLFPPVPSYQIDRGRLENDLRQIVEEMGVIFFEGVLVNNIRLATGNEQHTVECTRKIDGVGFSLTGRWVIDALGRRRYLQTKLGLTQKQGHLASAAWWRYEGRVDVDNLASGKDAQHWRSSPIEKRYYSTNHLMDTGYWVWLIPLGSGATSVGIVTDETIHPQGSYGQSYEQALEWLKKYEPVLWEHIRDKEPLDFHSLKNYSYSSSQIYSHQRWSCVGEAGIFVDPLYSNGSDFIALGNTVTTEMIRRERDGKLTGPAVERYNKLVLELLSQIYRDYYQGTYCTLGHAQIFTSKLTWDTAVNWSFVYPIYAQGLLRDPPDEVFVLGGRYRELNKRMQMLFTSWARTAPPRGIHVRGDMTRMRLMQLLHMELATRRDQELVLAVMQKNLDRLEELAQVLFWQAVQECYPGHPILLHRPWINVWNMVLEPEKWHEQGMFAVTTAPRPLRSMRANLTGIFAPQSAFEYLIYDLPYHAMHWWRGFVMYKIIFPAYRSFIVGKPAMWLRKVFVKDYPS